MTLLLFSVIVFFIAVTGPYVFGDIGVAITSFFVGLCGFFIYPLLVLAIYGSLMLISGKKHPARGKWIMQFMLLLAAVFFIVHTATAERFYGEGYGSYLGACWSAASESVSGGTGGGVLFGLIAYPVRAVLSAAGAYVLYSFLIAGVIFWMLMGTPLKKRIFRSGARRQAPSKEEGEAPVSYDDIPVPDRAAALPADGRPAYAPPVYGQTAQQPAYAQNTYAQTAQQPAYAQSAQAVRQPVYHQAPSPYPQQPQQYPQAAPSQQPRPAQGSAEPSRSSRDILFRGGDPASSYRNNLIFDRDSRFNTYPRRSSVSPVQEEPAAYNAQTAVPAAQPPRYSEQYAARTAEDRPAMPRRVTVERAVSGPLPEDDFNYPQSPSYRAPAQAAAEEHDYYSNDVPYEETFSSEPNVSDYEVPAEPAPAAYEAPSEPSRPVYGAAAVPDAGYDAPPAEPPVRPSYGVRQDAEERVSPAAAQRPEAENAPAPRSETAQETPMTREEYRSVFSRPVEERIHISDTPAAPEIPENTFARDRFSVPEDPDVMSSRGRFAAPEPQDDVPDEPPAGSRVFDSPMRSAADLLDDDEPEIDDADYREAAAVPDMPSRGLSSGRSMERPLTDRTERMLAERTPRAVSAAPAGNEGGAAPVPQKHVYKAYVRPDLHNLASYQETASISQEEIEQNSAIIVETLGGFRVDAEVVKVTVGSAVTRYDIDIPRNVTVSAVIKRDAEIAMRLHARDGVNIYSNSEAGAISIEVPNSRRATVGLKSVMQSEEYVNAKPNSLVFAIGKDVEGRNVCGNIVKMKHLLVAGATGSGKSVCLNSMLISLICKYSPEELRLILIDPKKVEFAVFDGLPHLMINEIIADAQKAISALNWAIKEMERRYSLFEKKTRSGINVHNLDEYNAHLTEDEEKLAKIVIVVDELADLMSVAKKEIEDRIQRLAQKARAAGMHLVIATQRPSVDVITGVIKGNLPTRLAFRVIQEVDSRTILDESGAQKLLGNGDMLYRTEGMYNCLRVQGAFVGSEEVQKIVQDIKANNEAYFDESVADFINREESGGMGGGIGDDADDGAVDPQYIKALAIVVKLGQASISLIQRKCSVGYNHAGKIIEWMELMGYISAFDGKAKARTVLLSKEDFEAKYGDLD